jgi:hypothetical protein
MNRPGDLAAKVAVGSVQRFVCICQLILRSFHGDEHPQEGRASHWLDPDDVQVAKQRAPRPGQGVGNGLLDLTTKLDGLGIGPLEGAEHLVCGNIEPAGLERHGAIPAPLLT